MSLANISLRFRRTFHRSRVLTKPKIISFVYHILHSCQRSSLSSAPAAGSGRDQDHSPSSCLRNFSLFGERDRWTLARSLPAPPLVSKLPFFFIFFVEHFFLRASGITALTWLKVCLSYAATLPVPYSCSHLSHLYLYGVASGGRAEGRILEWLWHSYACIDVPEWRMASWFFLGMFGGPPLLTS